MGLPDGVKVEVAPPIEKRIAIGGTFLDEVRISSRPRRPRPRLRGRGRDRPSRTVQDTFHP